MEILKLNMYFESVGRHFLGQINSSSLRSDSRSVEDATTWLVRGRCIKQFITVWLNYIYSFMANVSTILNKTVGTLYYNILEPQFQEYYNILLPFQLLHKRSESMLWVVTCSLRWKWKHDIPTSFLLTSAIWVHSQRVQSEIVGTRQDITQSIPLMREGKPPSHLWSICMFLKDQQVHMEKQCCPSYKFEHRISYIYIY